MNRANNHEPCRKQAVSLYSRASDLLYRYGVYAIAATFLGVSIVRSLTPIEIFASEAERQNFLSSIGEADPTRIIALVTEWCPACRNLESELNDRHIKYARLDIEKDRHGRELFDRVYAATGSNTIPKVILDRNVVARAQLFLLNQK